MMTVPELAEYLKVSVATIYRMVEKHSVPHIRVLGSIRFHQNDVDAWLKKETERSMTRDISPDIKRLLPAGHPNRTSRVATEKNARKSHV